MRGTDKMGKAVSQRQRKCVSPFCVKITGDRADGSGEIHSLESVEKCLIASKSAEHVYSAKDKSEHSSNVVQTANKREGEGFSYFCHKWE